MYYEHKYSESEQEQMNKTQPYAFFCVSICTININTINNVAEARLVFYRLYK